VGWPVACQCETSEPAWMAESDHPDTRRVQLHQSDHRPEHQQAARTGSKTGIWCWAALADQAVYPGGLFPGGTGPGTGIYTGDFSETCAWRHPGQRN